MVNVHDTHLDAQGINVRILFAPDGIYQTRSILRTRLMLIRGVVRSSRLQEACLHWLCEHRCLIHHMHVFGTIELPAIS